MLLSHSVIACYVCTITLAQAKQGIILSVMIGQLLTRIVSVDFLTVP